MKKKQKTSIAKFEVKIKNFQGDMPLRLKLVLSNADKKHSCFSFHHLFVYSCLQAISDNTKTVHLDLVTSEGQGHGVSLTYPFFFGFDKQGKWIQSLPDPIQSFEKWLITIISTQMRLKFSNLR